MASLVLFLLLLGLLAYLVAETWLHNRRWRRIPVRVHVNGTRGKSSTTRLIAAGLRSTGRKVLAKTTGTEAHVILPNGRELPLFRPLGANIREQFRVIRLASQLGAEALVIECMALQPEYQWITERWFVHATHGVVTNARPDHLEVMGPGSRDVALALAGTVPRRGVLFTGEQKHLEVIAEACDDRGTEMVSIGAEQVAAIGSRELAGFRHREHPQNVALALAVCERLGADREQALAAMWACEPDAGAMFVMELDFFGRRVVFVNGFAANDPESSAEIWHGSMTSFGAERKRIVLINCRADRADRSRQHGQAAAEWADADHVLVMGTGTPIFCRAAVRAGLDSTRLTVLEGAKARDVLEQLIALADDKPVVVVGLCNIGGEGLELLNMIRNRSRLVPLNASEAVS